MSWVCGVQGFIYRAQDLPVGIKKEDKLFSDREFLVIISRDSEATTKGGTGSLLPVGEPKGGAV